MVAFNQPVADTEGEATKYTRLSKPISDPKPISPQAKLLEGVDTAVTKGSEELNKTFEKAATDTAYNAGQEIQSRYGNAVQAVHESIFPQDKNPDADTLTPGAPATPAGVQQGLKDVSNIQTAYQQGSAPGHIRETQYLKDLYLKASQLRSQWPSYRDYIDKGIEKATGITPNANAYIKSMLADINEQMTKKNSESDKKLTHVITEAAGGNPIANDALNLHTAGTIDVNEAFNRTSQSNLTKFQAAQAEQKYKILETGTKTAQQYAVNDIRGTLTPYTNQRFRDIMDHLGLTQDNMDRISKNNLSFEDIGVIPRDALSYLNQQRQIVQAEHDKYLDTPITMKDGTKTTRRVMAQGDLDKIQKDSMQPFDMLEKAFTDKDFGYVNRVANAVKDMNAGMTYNVWKSPDAAAQYLKATHAVKEFGGDQAVAAGLIGSQGFLNQITVSNLNAIIGDNLSRAKTGGLDGMKQTLATIDKETHGENPAATRSYIDSLIKLIGAPEVKVEGKINLLDHVFDPKEDGWMGLIKEGGQSIARHDLFAKFTTPKFAADVEKIAHDYGRPDLIDKYHSFIQNSFGQDLFRADISELAQFQARQGVGLVWNTPKGQAPQFEARPKTGFFGAGVRPAARAEEINRQLTKLNMGIRAMYNVFHEETPAMLMREFAMRGVNMQDPDSLNNRLGKAIGTKASSDTLKGDTRSSLEQTPSSGTAIPPSGGAITQQMQGADEPWPFRGTPQTNAWQDFYNKMFKRQ